jgi:hypothetical protein
MTDYDSVTPWMWFEYEMGTIEYDYKVHPEAVERIFRLVKQLLYTVEKTEEVGCDARSM